MSKKSIGIGEGIAAGCGFFIGYLITKGLAVILFILGVLWIMSSMCNSVFPPKYSASDPTTNRLVNIALEAPTVSFKNDCAIRALPSKNSTYLGSVAPERKYKVIAKKGSWKKILVNDLDTGWTLCRPNQTTRRI
jgi:hypothetical protein